MNAVETNIEPPELDNRDGEDGDTCVTVSLSEADGTYRSAHMNLAPGTDDEIADALVRCAQGLAAMRGSDLMLALARRLSRA